MAAPKGNQYAKGHGKGRPIKWDDDAIENEALALLDWIKSPSSYYIGVFAESRGYDRAQMKDFVDKNKVFANAYRRARQWQENMFITKGLSKEWDSTFASRIMARVCNPEWRNSWDQPESTTVEHIGNVTINKVTKK